MLIFQQDRGHHWLIAYSTNRTLSPIKQSSLLSAWQHMSLPMLILHQDRGPHWLNACSTNKTLYPRLTKSSNQVSFQHGNIWTSINAHILHTHTFDNVHTSCTRKYSNPNLLKRKSSSLSLELLVGFNQYPILI